MPRPIKEGALSQSGKVAHKTNVTRPFGAKASRRKARRPPLHRRAPPPPPPPPPRRRADAPPAPAEVRATNC
jgi:hypothetical protein